MAAALAAGPLGELVDDILERARSAPPTVVGISGPVAVGKTTLAASIGSALIEAGVTVSTLSADAFLRPNEELAADGLMMRKGFPETFDLAALVAAVGRLRRGDATDVPVYSHDTYDRLPGVTARIEPAAAVIVEGVVVLHPRVAAELDVAVYVDALEDDVVEWFTGRFLDLCAQADQGTGAPFYEMFAPLSADERRAMARRAWDGINAVNLAEHIAPSRDNADVVIVKAGDHSIVAVDRRVRRSG